MSGWREAWLTARAERTVDERLAANRRNWNERTPIHAVSDFYDVASFKAGRITLCDVERREVGDVAGKSLLHLQCHFGLDTMSWARLGATATGVDFSDAAVREARSLNDELGLDVRFVESNVYDLPAVLEGQFDIVYTAIGALCWLPDLAAWAQVAAHFVKPGGMFYVLDMHPVLGVFESIRASGEAGSQEDLRVRYPYFPQAEGLFFPGNVPSYAGDQLLESGCYEWPHSVGEIIGAVSAAGFAIEFFHEFAANRYQAFPGMVADADGWWRFPGDNPLPQLFSLRARKPP